MILKNDLIKYCKLTSFNLGQVERDYLQHLFLLFLSKYSLEDVIFKGGTALQKAFGLNRFSIDLDFTQKNEKNFIELIKKVENDLTSFGYPSSSEEIKTIGKTFNVKIKGPLYSNNPMSIFSLKIEISQRESVLLPPILKEITPIYEDLQPYKVFVMHEEEILAEKVRAIMTRNKSRDVFDLHFLLRKGVKFDVEFINKKLEYYKEKYDKKKFIQKLSEKNKLWDAEMKNYVLTPPDFDEVKKFIINNFRVRRKTAHSENYCE